MASLTVRTCERCHHKKIRCPGYPECQNCLRNRVDCIPYRRQRNKDSAEALKYYKQRTCWLEEQLQQHFDISCVDIPTGTSLRPRSVEHAGDQTALPAESDGLLPLPLNTGTQDTTEASVATEGAPEASLVALNATGDMRYLGPSSGIFFALYANAFAQLSSLGNELDSASSRPAFNPDAPRGDAEAPLLSSATIQFLVRSYRIWIEPLYFVLDGATLHDMVLRCSAMLDSDICASQRTPEEDMDLSIFYLVLALGAVNQDSTVRLLRSENLQVADVDSAALCRKALSYLNAGTKCRVPSIPFIKILLLFSIYSMHGSVATNQWQLVGSAMRLAVELGLHTSSRDPRMPQVAQEERKRLFWTVYSVEISLAYNLGRPPSIGEEHITVGLPTRTDASATSILHFKHRRIQSRIVAKVYGANSSIGCTAEAQAQISQLQQELDAWKEDVLGLSGDAMLAYPYHFWMRLYHSTTFVLHRTSPLCPNPMRVSVDKCLHSAGAYVDAILRVLQHSCVPLSWMLVQGVLFAGLTMLVTARMSAGQLNRLTDVSLVLLELPAWTRQCCVCLAIMNERWNEPLLSTLTAQFERAVNDTLRFLADVITAPQEISEPWQSSAGLTLDSWPVQDGFEPADGTVNSESHFELMRDVMGFDPDQNFWDLLLKHQ